LNWQLVGSHTSDLSKNQDVVNLDEASEMKCGSSNRRGKLVTMILGSLFFGGETSPESEM
jgi:hypothetical protein